MKIRLSIKARFCQDLKKYKPMSPFLLNKLFLEKDSCVHKCYLCEHVLALLSF